MNLISHLIDNSADVHLCSSPELLFDSENAEKSEQLSEGR